MPRTVWLVGLTLALIVAGGIALWANSVPRALVPRPVQWTTMMGDMELTIVDPRGLVRGVRAGVASDIASDRTAVANPSGDHRQLAVQWLSFPCETRPRITLGADPDVVRITLDRDVREMDACESMGVERNITMDLAVDVPASAVQIEESD
jgi:hypothetical protein